MENKYFYCYSKPLKDFFLKKGLRYVIKSVHEKTHKKYWLFEGTDELNQLLDEWRLRTRRNRNLVALAMRGSNIL